MGNGWPLYPRMRRTGAGRAAAADRFRPSPWASLTTTSLAPAASAPAQAAATSASIWDLNVGYPGLPFPDSSRAVMPATPSMSALTKTFTAAP